MSGIIQTYHPTADGTRGVHAFTTIDPFEALALAHALKMRREIAAFLNWSEAITGSLEQTHGEGSVTNNIREFLGRLDALVDAAGGFHRG